MQKYVDDNYLTSLKCWGNGDGVWSGQKNYNTFTYYFTNYNESAVFVFYHILIFNGVRNYLIIFTETNNKVNGTKWKSK